MKKFNKYYDAAMVLEELAVTAAGVVDNFSEFDHDDFTQLSMQDMARLQKRMQNLYEAIDSSKKKIGSAFDDIRTRHLPTKMDSEDITKFAVEGLGTVSLTDDLRIKVLDKHTEFEWLEQIGSGDLIQDTVNAGSLKALLRRRLVAGEEIPGDVFDIAPFTRASITKR